LPLVPLTHHAVGKGPVHGRSEFHQPPNTTLRSRGRGVSFTGNHTRITSGGFFKRDSGQSARTGVVVVTSRPTVDGNPRHAQVGTPPDHRHAVCLMRSPHRQQTHSGKGCYPEVVSPWTVTRGPRPPITMPRQTAHHSIVRVQAGSFTIATPSGFPAPTLRPESGPACEAA